MKMDNKRKGMLLAALGGCLWGFSGVLAQLILDCGIGSEWLVSCRLLLGGLCILVYSGIFKHEHTWAIFRSRRAVIRLVCFSFIGMSLVQYAFFKTIELSSAAFATIIQFISPVLLYGYELARGIKRLRLLDLSLIIAAIFGVVLVVTDGEFSRLHVSLPALLVGLLTALSVVSYTVLPQPLIKTYGAAPTVGFGMFIAGGCFQFWHPLSGLPVHLDAKVLFYLTLMIILGTVVAFLAYLQSTVYIPGSMACLFTALEPLLVSILSVFIFGKRFSYGEVIGIAIIMVSILLFSKVSKTQAETRPKR